MRRKTRFVCVSDTHSYAPSEAGFKLPPGDVLIHAGDLTNNGSMAELRKTMAWIAQADFETKIIIGGQCLSRCPTVHRPSSLSSAKFLNEQATTISPWIRHSMPSMDEDSMAPIPRIRSDASISSLAALRSSFYSTNRPSFA